MMIKIIYDDHNHPSRVHEGRHSKEGIPNHTLADNFSQHKIYVNNIIK